MSLVRTLQNRHKFILYFVFESSKTNQSYTCSCILTLAYKVYFYMRQHIYHFYINAYNASNKICIHSACRTLFLYANLESFCFSFGTVQLLEYSFLCICSHFHQISHVIYCYTSEILEAVISIRLQIQRIEILECHQNWPEWIIEKESFFFYFMFNFMVFFFLSFLCNGWFMYHISNPNIELYKSFKHTSKFSTF